MNLICDDQENSCWLRNALLVDFGCTGALVIRHARESGSIE